MYGRYGKLPYMVKTTVYLPDTDMRALKAAARRRHQSEAELIREGIRRVLAEEAGPALPDFGILDADPVTAADIDAALAAGLGAAGIER
jgi:Arc/MetJ-type ribon-helix-helix transcriptional regulator